MARPDRLVSLSAIPAGQNARMASRNRGSFFTIQEKEEAMEKPLGSNIPRTLEEVCDPRHMGSFWRSQPTTPNFHCRAGALLIAATRS